MLDKFVQGKDGFWYGVHFCERLGSAGQVQWLYPKSQIGAAVLLPLGVFGDAWRPVIGCLLPFPPGGPWRAPYPGAGGTVPPETPLQPSLEQDAIVAARRADPQGSLRVLAFAGTGKTTALQLLAQADPPPGLYLAYNKAAQLAARARFPAHIACRTVHSLAFRAIGRAGQLQRLERKLAGRDVAELLAIPALDGLRPSFWGYCVIATVRNFSHDGTAHGVGPEHLPPLPRGADRTGPVLAWARQLWALLRDPAGALPLEHDAYLKMWHLEGACLPDWAEVLYVDEAQDADPVTLAILQAQHRPTVWVGDPWQSIYRFRGSVNAMRMIDAPQRPLTRSWRFGEELARVARQGKRMRSARSAHSMP